MDGKFSIEEHATMQCTQVTQMYIKTDIHIDINFIIEYCF